MIAHIHQDCCEVSPSFHHSEFQCKPSSHRSCTTGNRLLRSYHVNLLSHLCIPGLNKSVSKTLKPISRKFPLSS